MFLLLVPVSARAQIRWSERDVVRLARERPADVRMAEALVAAAAAREEAAGLPADPALSWEREALPGNEASSQDILRVTVPLDLGARRSARRLLARSASATARADAATMRADAVEEAVLAFYAALAEERRVEILAQAVADLEEAARVLARREEAGMASGYERDRLEIETELMRSRVSEAEAELVARKTALVALLAPDMADAPAAAITLTGDLATQEPAPLDALLGRALDAHPAVHEAARAARAAEAAETRARGRAWVPGVAITGGIHMARDPDSRSGYVAGLALELPVLSRGREIRAEAAGQRRLAMARRAALEQDIRQDIAEARIRLVAARRELERFDGATRERIELLGRAATSGYQEGHRTIMELLDVQRARTEVRLRSLELSATAKRAEVHLRRATGDMPGDMQ